jgi:hypothetical protein
MVRSIWSLTHASRRPNDSLLTSFLEAYDDLPDEFVEALRVKLFSDRTDSCFVSKALL